MRTEGSYEHPNYLVEQDQASRNIGEDCKLFCIVCDPCNKGKPAPPCVEAVFT